MDPLKPLAQCGGFYECPRDSQRKRTGPLVGYAGRDEEGRQFVGDIYVNFSKAERHGPVLRWVARQIATKAERGLNWAPFSPENITGFCGAPEGGKALAIALAMECKLQYIFPEKKVTAVATGSSREVSELIFKRHEPKPGERWWIVEDICNNFSTTTYLISLIQSHGAEVAGILCFLNRSLTVEDVFRPKDGDDSAEYPVVTLVRKPIKQYSQDDPEVADDIAQGNIVWKPKDQWKKLAESMEKQRTEISQEL